MTTHLGGHGTPELLKPCRHRVCFVFGRPSKFPTRTVDQALDLTIGPKMQLYQSFAAYQISKRTLAATLEVQRSADFRGGLEVNQQGRAPVMPTMFRACSQDNNCGVFTHRPWRGWFMSLPLTGVSQRFVSQTIHITRGNRTSSFRSVSIVFS